MQGLLASLLAGVVTGVGGFMIFLKKKARTIPRITRCRAKILPLTIYVLLSIRYR